MPYTVLKKVRMSPRDARRLARLAREKRSTESDILREGLDLVHRLRDRKRAVQDLIALIHGQEPAKLRWSLKP